jgi:hypothetical protein
MKHLFRSLALAIAAMTGLAAVPVRASEELAGVIQIEDKAGLFSADGIAKAKHAFESTVFKSKTHLLVVTADHVPPAKQAEWDEIAKNKDDKGRNRFAEEWARAMGRTKDHHGDIVVLVYRSPAGGFFVSTVSDKQSDVHRHFSDAKAREVDGVFLRELRKVKADKLEGDAAKKEMDAALVSATELVISNLKDTSAPDTVRKTGSSNHVAAEHKGGGIGGWICMLIAIGLGVWLVIGLIRAFTGGGGGGGPGGGYGGGGGGFMTSLMGGMFGAMAGMWMYNNLMGGHDYHNDAMAGDNYGSDGAGNTGDGNYDDGAAATDGDWGDGGGDAGGGDWGGDGGGGGDWGGGGGDFGGGGGDW